MKKRKNKATKIGFIFIILILSLASISISYGGLVDDLNIFGTVDTSTDFSERYLRAYWPLDENDGTIIYDSSVHGNDGNIYGPNWAIGKVNSALSFDGDDHVLVPHSSSLDISENISVEAWVKLNEVPYSSYQTIIRKGPWTTEMSWGLDIKPEGNPRFFIYDEGVAYIALGSTTLVSNVWYHLRGTYDGTVVKLWVNGSVDSSTSHVGDIDLSNDDLVIGKHNGGGYLNGIIDEIKIYSEVWFL